MRFEIALLVVLDRYIRLRRVPLGRVNAPHHSVRRQIGDVVRDVRPTLTAIACDMHQPVVRPRPEYVSIHRRLVERVNHAAVLHSDVVRGETARDSLFRLIVCREVGTDNLPALAAVCRSMHMLACHKNRVVIVQRYVKWERPLETVLQFRRRPPARVLRPHFNWTELSRALVITHDNPTARTGAGRTRPNYVRIRRVWGRKPALATANRMPHAAGNASTTKPAHPAVARAPGGRPVLAVTHDVVRNRVVCGDVVHLRDRKLNSVPCFAAVDRDGCTAVVAHDHAVAICGIDPHVVIVSTRTLAPAERRAGAPAVGRVHERRGEKEDFVRIVG